MLNTITERILLVFTLFAFSSINPIMAESPLNPIKAVSHLNIKTSEIMPSKLSNFTTDALKKIEKININTATVNDFTMIKGLGEKKANTIIKYREIYGDFKKTEDLLRVSGIGKVLLEKIRPFISI